MGVLSGDKYSSLKHRGKLSEAPATGLVENIEGRQWRKETWRYVLFGKAYQDKIGEALQRNSEQEGQRNLLRGRSSRLTIMITISLRIEIESSYAATNRSGSDGSETHGKQGLSDYTALLMP